MATMEDVAREAGVALSTVSYALSGTRPVSQATRDKIDAAMERLGYRPNVLARGLASRRSGILALALPPARRGLGQTELDFVNGAVDAAEERGQHVIVWPAALDSAADVEALLGNGLVDGVVLMEVRLDDPRVDALAAEKRPFAMIGRTSDPAGLPYVDIDFEQTLDDAVAHLADLGHRSIAFVNHSRADFDAGYGPTVRSSAAFAAAIDARDLTGRESFCRDDAGDGVDTMERLLAEQPDLTAAIVMNEAAVPGMLQTLTSAGRRVPDDFSLVSVVSSTAVARMTLPALTVFEAPGRALGRAGVETLLDVIDGASEHHTPVLVPCQFVAGDSTAAAPA